jgi:hypothetical protein
MLLARILLVGNGAAFALYGLVCVFSPEIVGESSGMELPGPSSLTEVVAMYGGLQMGIGLLFLSCAFRPARVEGGLRLMVVLLGSLALARTVGLLAYGFSAYNVGALVYESLAALAAFVAIKWLSAFRGAG